MEKMLGNQYFMARKFTEAAPYLLRAHKKTPRDMGVLRNLIITEVIVGDLHTALRRLPILLKSAPEMRKRGRPCP